jgi:hypothetical protein
MSKYILFRSALGFSILAGMVVVDCGPLATPTFAQRPSRDRDNDDDDERGGDQERRASERGGDEGGNRWEGRRGWGGRRGGGFGGRDGGQRRGRERQRDEDGDDDEDQEDEGGQDRSNGFDISGYARDLVKQYDKNGDMMLQEEERGDLRGPAARADLDNDNVITVEEIVSSLSNRQPPGRGGRDRRSGGERASGSSDRAASQSESAAKKRVYTSIAAGASGKDSGKEADKRKSYRFTPAQERLTGNLPSWFKSRDRNEDGQVSMSEYSRSWTARLVRQFQDIDLNDDGVITPKEAAE